MPEADYEWSIPQHWNAFERNRSRAYDVLWSMLISLRSLMDAYRLYDMGEQRVAQLNAGELDKAIPKEESRGAGFWARVAAI